MCHPSRQKRGGPSDRGSAPAPAARAPRPAGRPHGHAEGNTAWRLPTVSPFWARREAATERRTYAVRLAYDGGAFRGWQRQPGRPTVQQALEDSLAAVLGERAQVHGAARTDAGVHAEGQVASFTLRRALPAGDLLAMPVPQGLRIDAAAPARRSFHARASAAGKRYRYRFAAGSPVAWDLG